MCAMLKMSRNLSIRALAASLVFPSFLVLALSSFDIPTDLPISSLLSSANNLLANGQTNDALVYYDVAIARDPQNYLTYFKRGATYLSLGKNSQAIADFDKVLSIKPGFEGALLQRAKIRARNGDWNGSKEDYLAHGNSVGDLAQLKEAEGAYILSTAAEKAENWQECIAQSSKAITVASKMLNLRKTRAHCRLENGDLLEGISDLKHILQLQPGMTEPHLQISAILFYELANTEQGLDQLRKCLHFDPDSKDCKNLYRQENKVAKKITRVRSNLDMKQFATSIKSLIPTGNEVGLLQEVRDEIKSLQKSGTITGKPANQLLVLLLGMTCEAYHKQKNFEKGKPWCQEALKYDPHNLYGLLSQAHHQIEDEIYEAAINTLNKAADKHPESHEVNQMIQEAQAELKRSKNKDYYKVLGLPRDADKYQIKSAYRRLVKLHHPDKAHKLGISKEAAEKKMAAINEAHETLSNPELKERYDNGDDPNDNQHNPFAQHGEWFHSGNFRSFGGKDFTFQFY